MAGGYHQRLTVEQPIKTTNELGEQEISWAAVTDIWGTVTPLKSNEILWARQAQLQTTHRVRCWYFDGLKSSHRLSWLQSDGTKRVLNIAGIVNTSEQNVEYVIDCTEKTSG